MKLQLGLFLILLMSCGGFQAKRVDAEASDKKALKITDSWVAEDTRAAVEEIIKQLESHPGFARYKAERGGKLPKLFVAEVQNLTSEAYFPINDINDEFLHELSISGEYILVDAAQRDRILEELTYMHDGMVDKNDVKKLGKQAGADLMVFGNVFMRPQSRNGKTIKEYAVNLRLTDIERGVEVARARKRVFKYSEKKSWGF